MSAVVPACQQQPSLTGLRRRVGQVMKPPWNIWQCRDSGKGHLCALPSSVSTIVLMRLSTLLKWKRCMICTNKKATSTSVQHC
jgi:hypothetical protein